MGLKRKRSSEYTYSPSSASVTSMSSCASSSPSPHPWQSGPARPDIDMQMELNFPIVKQTSWDFDSGRTRKRWRNRPDIHAVHGISPSFDSAGPVLTFKLEHTFQKLFNAQKEHPGAEPILSHDSAPAIHRPALPQKSTLHAFWNIRQPQPIFVLQVSSDGVVQQSCECCDRALRSTDGMGADFLEGNNSGPCIECKRQICDFCAVNLEARRCLDCVQR